MTRLVRWQLLVFATVTVLGVSVMAVGYMRIPDAVGLGRYNVKVELADTGGLYATSNVTFRGSTVGRVTSVEVTGTGARAVLDLDSSIRVPADSRADVHSRSAIGEQYLDLVPGSSSSPYLADGDTIPVERTTVPQDIGPLLDTVNRSLRDIPRDQLATVIDTAYEAFDGQDPALRRLLDSVHALMRDGEENLGQTTALLRDIEPVLRSQADSSESIRRWASSLQVLSDQAAGRDAAVRRVIDRSPAALGQVNALFQQVRPTLPILLANAVSLGQVAVTYNPSLEQILVVMPQGISALATIAVPNMDGTERGFLSFNTTTLNSSPPCTTGFLPASARRDGSAVDSPPRPDQALYCAIPQDSQIAVRGSRNLPCMGRPGRRAPTVEICKRDEPYRPLGDNPWFGEPAAVEGDPTPGAPISPSSHSGGDAPVAVAPYDPRTGVVSTPGGTTFVRDDLGSTSGGRNVTWKQMLTPAR